jgi:hypothetical protein
MMGLVPGEEKNLGEFAGQAAAAEAGDGST